MGKVNRTRFDDNVAALWNAHPICDRTRATYYNSKGLSRLTLISSHCIVRSQAQQNGQLAVLLGTIKAQIQRDLRRGYAEISTGVTPTFPHGNHEISMALPQTFEG